MEPTTTTDSVASSATPTGAMPPPLDDSTFASWTIPSPVDDTSTMASEGTAFPSNAMEDVDPFEIGNVDEDEEIGGLGDANQHSLPDPEELKVNQGSSSGATGCAVGTWVAIILALLVALITGLAVGLTADNRQEATSGGSGSAFVPVAREKVKIEMRDYLVSYGVSSSGEFVSSTNPQYRALAFLGDQDPMQLNAPKAGLDSNEGYAFLTRYVMAVFYYATNGPAWNYDLLYLSKHETCDWYDVFQPPVGQIGVICSARTKEIVGVSFISNELDGTLPSELGTLTTLSYIESIGNNIKGTIPDRLKELTKLRTVVFAYNQLGGSIPAWINSWQNLEFLYLSNNLLVSSVPSSMRELKELSVIALDDNSLTGSVDFVWELPKIEYVYLEDNAFTGRLPAAIVATSPLMINFDVSTNSMYGALPADLFQLNRLEILDLHSNAFTGEIPSDVMNGNEQLKFVSMYSNLLGRTIPTTLGRLQALTHLDLSQNQFTGGIPNELSNLQELSYLFLAENELLSDGPIPVFIYDYAKLKELSLKNTKRTGKISELIELLSSLILLDLDDNSLTGPIPSEIGVLTDLQFLLLNRNELSEAIPQQLGNLNNLQFLLLDNNNITGSLETVCEKQSLDVAIADCQPEVQCTCCSPCCTDGEDCHDNNLVSNINPIWERGYERQFFDFANTTGFFVSNGEDR